MATATSASPVAASAPSPAQPAPAPGRPQLKGSVAATTGNANRRSTQSPIDGQRRNSSHKGWQNTAQQQKFNNGSAAPTSSSPTPSQAAASMRSRPSSTVPGGESDTHDKHMHDRTLFLLTRLAEHEVIVTVKSGAQYKGQFIGADPRNHDIGVSLKWVKLFKAGPGDGEDKAKEGEYVGGGPEKIVVFEQKDVVDIQGKGLSFNADVPGASQNGVSGGFKTDTDISGNTAQRERELHRWQPDESAEVGLGLEDTSAGPGQGWNQFEANERLFGVKSDFDENIYTTKLDRDHPEYHRRAAAAARIAAEIEGQSSAGLNSHVAEERGIATADDSGMDEEDKYSGVQRNPIPSNITNTNPNRYTPPARRAPTGQPTVPGAPHDPAIISSQLVRPETLQQKQPQTAQATPQIVVPKAPDDTVAKVNARPGLPEIITPMRSLPAGTAGPPPIERDLSINFKNFVNHEKERVKKKKADMAHRDRETKLRELKKFSESFTLKTAVPQDLVPILTKDKAKQAEILEKAKAAVNAAAASGQSTPSAPTTQPTASGSQAGSSSGKALPPNSFAARDPERFKRETNALLVNFPQNFPKFNQQPPVQSLSQNVRRVQQDKNLPIRPPMPVTENRPQFPPTGPSAGNTGQQQKRFNVNARPFEFRPNPSAAAFTPTFSGPSTNATPSPTAPAHTNIASRAISPSAFFGNKRLKTGKERPSIKDHFNAFDRMKAAPPPPPPPPSVKVTLYGNSLDYIEKPWNSLPTWPTPEANKDKSYKTMFAVKADFDQGAVHSPQPGLPHMMPPQPHHQQLPQHMPHISHPPHVAHQPHHGPVPQHLGVPPHYDQEHLRQMSSPSSVMPSPSLNPATVAQYQQSPVPQHSHIAMYPGQQGAMGQFVPPPGAPFQFYGSQFRGPTGSPMMMHNPQQVPYPGQMGGQFVHPQTQMYSPQQPQAYLNNGPPPPSQGFPSPGRGAPMMMHQGSSQGTPGAAQMMPYVMQPGQGGPMYAQQQQMGMMRGQQPPPPHQGGPPHQYYHGPQQQQGHYPPNRPNSYQQQQQQQQQHGMAPPPPQQQQQQQHQQPQQQQMAPPPPPQPQAPQQPPAETAGEDAK